MAASNAGGYEHNFLEQASVLKEFECPLCLHVTREPTLTSCCGQHFCWYCINRITTNRKPCPFCKEKTFTVFLDKKQKRKVLELTVSCTMKERGCTWAGELGNLDAHNGGCQYVDVICSNKCGKSFQRRYLCTHLLDLCPNRRFVCIFCFYEDTYINIHSKHYPKCLRYPIPCPNECEIVSVERRLMSKHLNECPKQLVECRFTQAGCAKFRRQEVGKEMRLLMIRLDKKDKKIRELKTRLDEKDKEVRELKNRMRKTRKEVGMLKTRQKERLDAQNPTYPCEICGQNFISKSGLLSHLRSRAHQRSGTTHPYSNIGHDDP